MSSLRLNFNCEKHILYLFTVAQQEHMAGQQQAQLIIIQQQQQAAAAEEEARRLEEERRRIELKKLAEKKEVVKKEQVIKKEVLKPVKRKVLLSSSISSSHSLTELHALRLRLEGAEGLLSRHVHICLGDDGVHDCGLKITELEVDTKTHNYKKRRASCMEKKNPISSAQTPFSLR